MGKSENIDALFISDYFEGLNELISSLNRYLKYTTKLNWRFHLNYLQKDLNEIEKLKVVFIINNIDDFNDLLKRHYSYLRICARNAYFPFVILTYSKITKNQNENISKIKIPDASNGISNFELINLCNISNLKDIRESLINIKYAIPDIWYFKHHDVANRIWKIGEKSIITEANKSIGEKSLNLKLNWKILVIDDDIDDIELPQNSNKKFYFKLFHRYLNQMLSLKEEEADLSNTFTSNKKVNYLSFEKVGENLSYIKTQLLNFDIVFIDIIEESKGSYNLTGLQKILPKFKQFRGIYKYPIIIIFSRLRSHEIGDLAFGLGADYYLSKDDFLFQYPNSLVNILKYILFRDKKLNEEYFKDNKDSLNKYIDLNTLIKEDLEDNFRMLLFMLFRNLLDERKLKVLKVFSKGKSGAYTFLIKIYKEDKFYESSIQRIVKIDFADNMVFEKNAYEKHISPYIENFAGRIESLATFGDYAAISYTSVGSRIDYKIGGLLDLEEFILQNPNYNKISKSIHTIYSEILSPIHSQNIMDVDNIKFKTIFDYFKNYLPPLNKIEKFDNVEHNNKKPFEIMDFSVKQNKKKIEKIKIKFRDLKTNDVYEWDKDIKNQSDEILKKSIKDNVLFRIGKRFNSKFEEKNNKDISNIFLSNFDRYSNNKNHAKVFKEKIEVKYKNNKNINIFDKFNQISIKQSRKPKKISIVHGDLNLGNIISTPRNNNFWIIDYGKTGYGLTSIDFVKPEVEIRTHILYELISNMTYDSNKSKNKDNLIEEMIEEMIKEMAKSIKLIEKMLINNNINNSDLKRFGKNKDIVKTCLLFIHEIRSFAFQHYYQNYEDRKEYWESLFYYSMTALKFPNLYPSNKNNGEYEKIIYKFLIPVGLLELAKITSEVIQKYPTNNEKQKNK